MDAQVAWDSLGSCSCWHGVTSVVMGNCGFALAPCKPQDREWFARCLTAVEDIPTESMLAGIDWTWESFPEYLAKVESLPKGLNYGMYIGHSALRMYAMGRRALDETADEDDLRAMEHAVSEAIRAGAMGFSTSRATTHVTPEDTPVASRIADWHEIDRLVGAMAKLNAGIFQVGPDISGGAAQRAFLDRMRQVAIETGRPIMFGMLATKQGVDPNPWNYQLNWMDETVALGGRAWGQATTRSINAVFSLKSYLPFDLLPAWKEIRALPLDEQKARLRDPEVRRRLVEDEARMKPKGPELQGGGAATTDPRKPDYYNLFAMLDVDWDDPSVGDLSRHIDLHDRVAISIEREVLAEYRLMRRNEQLTPTDRNVRLEHHLVGAVGGDPVRVQVDGQRTDRHRALPRRRPGRPAHHRIDAGLQLGHAERLHDVVVGADAQAGDPVALLGPRGHRDDGHVAAAAQLPADLQAVAVGQAQVE